MTEGITAATKRKRILQGLLSTVIVVGIFVGVMPRIASYGDVWDTITAMSSLELGGLFIFGAWNLATYWFVLTAVLPGLSVGQAAVSNQASTAVSNTMPGGGILGVGVTYAMYRSWGFTKADFARATIVSGIWNNYVKLGMYFQAIEGKQIEEIPPQTWLSRDFSSAQGFRNTVLQKLAKNNLLPGVRQGGAGGCSV